MKISRTLAIQAEYWLSWFGVTGIIWPVCFVMAVLASQGMALLIPPVAALVLGLLAGAILLGLVQFVLLQPPVKSDLLWALVTALGWLLGLTIFTLVMELTGTMTNGLIAAALGGVVSGAVQSLVMASGSRKKGAWSLVSLLGWTAAMALGFALMSEGDSPVLTGRLTVILVAWTVGWSILSIVALVAMATLLPKPEKRITDAHIRWW